MLIAPFQAIICSDTCSPETREQIVAALADFVKTKSERIGSGWKTLFGTLRALRTSEVDSDSVHWTVLDVIGVYLRIDKYSVLSWSLPDCLLCIVHFLQSNHVKAPAPPDGEVTGDSKPVEDQLSEAALRLVTPTYTVILNLFKTPHIPNPNLLHKAELRAICLDEVECVNTTSAPLSECLDPAHFPLAECDPSPLQLDTSLEGLPTACFCLSTLLLPHVQKWMRRAPNSDGEKTDSRRSDANLRQAVGICTQMVADIFAMDQSKAIT
ncbi:unnamed protein product [Strongylus vulgaris]|uniref:Mon2/Sec7/BIG1-like HDS domain-containing protein n=1 Tax=Strongylus vulgaris TaxID=40348 RepID=A0A3P7LU18_STRVU|nr:unnamed protein product [Strongylus vulgaris]